MRCTRCGGWVIPQAVGLLPDGTVVFGWCRGCLDEEDCALVEVPGKGLEALTRPKRKHLRTLRIAEPPRAGGPRPSRQAHEMRERGLSAAGIASMMLLWGLILMALGFIRLPGPYRPNPLPNGESRFLLVAGGMMAIASLCVWAATLERAWLRKVAVEMVRITSTIVAVATLVWGVVHQEPRENPAIVGVAALAITIAWLTHWYEHKRARPSPATTSSSAGLQRQPAPR